MNDKETQQIQCWIEDNSADVNSSDLFEQAKAYDLGIGVEEDKHKAASLYREAMNQGDKRAKHNLAMLLVTEEGDLSDKPTGIQMLAHQFDWIALVEIPMNNGYYAIKGEKTINGETTEGLYDVLYNVCNIPPGIYKHIYSVDKWMNVSVRGKNGKEGIVNMKQEVVVPTEYESVYHRDTTGPNQMYYKVYNYGADEGQRVWGLYLKNQQIMPCQYKESEVDKYIEEHP